jgi:hypothetical protein
LQAGQVFAVAARPDRDRAHVRFARGVHDRVGGDHPFVDPLHRRVVEVVREQPAGAVREAGFVGDDLGAGRERADLRHECGFGAAVIARPEHSGEVGRPPRDHDDGGDGGPAGRGRTDCDEQRERRDDRRDVVAEHRRFEHEQERAGDEPGEHRDGVGVDLALVRDDRGDDAEPDCDEQREVAADQRGDQLVQLFRRAEERRLLVVLHRLVVDGPEAPRQGDGEPERDRRGDRDDEVPDATRAPQPPCDRQRDRDDEHLDRERGAHREPGHDARTIVGRSRHVSAATRRSRRSNRCCRQ